MGAVTNPYLEAEILSSDPVNLVRLLYRGAIDAVSMARKHLVSGAIGQRSRSITKAWSILQELIRTLDHSQGGELSRNLAGLYVYMQSRLMEANSKQVEPPLIEVEGLLNTLLEGWQLSQMPSGDASHSAAPEQYGRLSFTG